jgi:hypothetical protein
MFLKGINPIFLGAQESRQKRRRSTFLRERDAFDYFAGVRLAIEAAEAASEEAEVRKRLWAGAASLITGLCLLSSPIASQAKTKPAISPEFIAKVNAYCSAQESRFNNVLGQFPYPNFNSLHPDVKTLRLVGSHFEKAMSLRTAISSGLKALGEPQAGKTQWAELRSLATQSDDIAIEQIHTALAGNVKGFITTVKQTQSVHNKLVKTAETAGFAKTSPCGDVF